MGVGIQLVCLSANQESGSFTAHRIWDPFEVAEVPVCLFPTTNLGFSVSVAFPASCGLAPAAGPPSVVDGKPGDSAVA